METRAGCLGLVVSQSFCAGFRVSMKSGKARSGCVCVDNEVITSVTQNLGSKVSVVRFSLCVFSSFISYEPNHSTYLLVCTVTCYR
ncbi:hypothetical protein BaRGS_00000893 [Batillaria attramentaria]|uniref:Secreted protein n=1 Tax=Batillaria attramentaria TaxID=370345 RepID=A0ABD0M8W5_9CAEN